MRIKIGDKLPNSELFYLDQNNDVKKIDILDLCRGKTIICLLYTSPSPRDLWISRMPSSA